MRALRHSIFLFAVLFSTSGCSTLTSYVDGVGDFGDRVGERIGGLFASTAEKEERPVSYGPKKTVRTTAYSHYEADSLPYGKKNAVGTDLKYGNVRSAAADWSVYPVGTVFRIDGEPYLYEVDDYGSALVGTETIDLYKPNMTAMRNWGVRHVDIQILRWGSFERSLAILEPRQHKAGHVRKMANSIRSKS